MHSHVTLACDYASPAAVKRTLKIIRSFPVCSLRSLVCRHLQGFSNNGGAEEIVPRMQGRELVLGTLVPLSPRKIHFVLRIHFSAHSLRADSVDDVCVWCAFACMCSPYASMHYPINPIHEPTKSDVSHARGQKRSCISLLGQCTFSAYILRPTFGL